MQNFTSTPEERCKQEVNIIAHDLNERLKALRKAAVANLLLERKWPVEHFIHCMKTEILEAARKMHEAELHWKV